MDRLLQLAFAGMGGLAIVLSVAARPTVPDGWILTTGKVVALVDIGDDGGARAPIVEYVDGAGGRHRIRSPVASAGPLVEPVGASVQVAYDPAAPDHATIVSGSGSLGWLLGLAIGLLFFTIGVGWFIYQVRHAAPPGVPAEAVGTTALVGGELAASSRVPPSAYVFARARSRIFLDYALAPAMGLMFAFFAWFLFAIGGIVALFGLLVAGVALMMFGSGVRAVFLGLTPAAEVGGAGIWFRGQGMFTWPEVKELRLESFVGAAGEAGTARYRRLAVVPHDPSRALRRPFWERLGWSAASSFYRNVMPAAGRRPIEFAPFGVYHYEVADFDGLVERARSFHPVLFVSDERIAEPIG